MSRGRIAWASKLRKILNSSSISVESVVGGVLVVGLLRTLLELMMAGQPRSHPPYAVINNVAFYVCLVSLHAALASKLTKTSIQGVLGPILLGCGSLACMPPLLDTLLAGSGAGYYYYVMTPENWVWNLIIPGAFSIGETIALWLGILAFAGYVLLRTASPWASALAAVGSYLSITVLAMAPVALVGSLPGLVTAAHRIGTGSHGGNAFQAFISTMTLIAVAQLAYLVCKPRLAMRLVKRSLHTGPFVALVYFGGALSQHFSPPGVWTGSALTLSVSALALYLLCLAALVQNDAFDTVEDGGQHSFCTTSDATFFTSGALLISAAALLASEYLGVPLGLFALATVIYSVRPWRAKRCFPFNYGIEGIWGASAFLLGVFAVGRGPDPLPRELLIAVALVFLSWFVFNCFKDIKDIRGDYKAGNQTFYVLALQNGIALRTTHVALRTMFAALLPLPAILLVLAGIDWRGLTLATVLGALPLFGVLGLGPTQTTVRGFLVGVTCFVAALTLALKYGI